MVPVRTLHVVLGRDDEQVSHVFLPAEVKTGEWNRMWGLHMEDTVFQTLSHPKSRQAVSCAARHKC